jgi:tetratricopeptide (TPR) repeat protein
MHAPELTAVSSSMALQVDVGQWDEALEAGERLLPEAEGAPRDVSDLLKLTVVHSARGEPGRGREIVDAYAAFADSEETQMRAAYDVYLAVQLYAEGDREGAVESAGRAIETIDLVGINTDSSKWAFVLGLSAAAALGDTERLRGLIARMEAIPPGLRSPMYQAQATRFKARHADASGRDDPEPLFKSAVGLFRELGTPFSLAVALLEHGEWLIAHERAEAALTILEEAGTIFGRLKARPWLERLDAIAPQRSTVG